MQAHTHERTHIPPAEGRGLAEENVSLGSFAFHTCCSQVSQGITTIDISTHTVILQIQAGSPLQTGMGDLWKH